MIKKSSKEKEAGERKGHGRLRKVVVTSCSTFTGQLADYSSLSLYLCLLFII